MRKVAGILGAIAAMSLHTGTMLTAADSMKDRDAPSLSADRLPQSTVKGTLVKIDGENYWVKVAAGQLMRIHVDKSTKADKVAEGDTIKASITEERHATTLQRQKQ